MITTFNLYPFLSNLDSLIYLHIVMLSRFMSKVILPALVVCYYGLCVFFRFGLYTQLHLIVYPQVIYPLSNISLTASIYMIVAITLERYCAVHYPVDYRQVSTYLFPLSATSILFLAMELEVQVLYKQYMQCVCQI